MFACRFFPRPAESKSSVALWQQTPDHRKGNLLFSPIHPNPVSNIRWKISKNDWHSTVIKISGGKKTRQNKKIWFCKHLFIMPYLLIYFLYYFHTMIIWLLAWKYIAAFILLESRSLGSLFLREPWYRILGPCMINFIQSYFRLISRLGVKMWMYFFG